VEDPLFLFFSDYSDWDASQKHGLKVLIVLKASRSSRFCSEAWIILDPKAIVPLADELVLKTASAVGISGFQVQPFQN